MQNMIQKIKDNHLVVIVRGVEQSRLIPLAEAMYDGGVRLLEVTYSANKSVSDEDTAKSIQMLCEHFKDRMMIGAGTVLTEEQVVLTAKAGGRFIISPNTDRQVIEKTKELGLISMPGAYTPSEIADAHKYGADFVKLFSVTALGAAYVKAVRAPLSHIPLLAVGGVDLSNLEEYAKAGVVGFGIGGNIIDKKLLDAQDYPAITRLAEEYVTKIQELF